MPSFRAASQAASAGAGSTICSKPAGTAPGDILVAFHATDAGTMTSMGIFGGGWNLLASRARDGSAEGGTKVWWKVAAPSEPSSYDFLHGFDPDAVVSIIAVQDGSLNTPVVAQSGSSGLTTSVSTPSTTPTGSDDFEIRCAIAQQTQIVAVTWTPPAGFTERTDVQSRTKTSAAVATRTLASSGATGTHTFTVSSNIEAWHGFTVNIAARSGFTGWGMPL
ncbi:hypothetical protein [Streptosporangium sp. NPDC003464]